MEKLKVGIYYHGDKVKSPWQVKCEGTSVYLSTKKQAKQVAKLLTKLERQLTVPEITVEDLTIAFGKAS